jgi:hypothetical protein
MDNMKIALALMKLNSHSLVCFMVFNFKKKFEVLLFSFSKFWKVGASYELWQWFFTNAIKRRHAKVTNPIQRP